MINHSHKQGYRDAEAEVVAKISDDRFLCRVHRVQQKHDIRSEGPVQEEQEERQDEEQREGEKGAHVHGADDVGLVVSQSVSNADSLISNSYITLDSSANTNNFVTVEMTVDSSAFEGQAEDVVVGAFVSFRYTAWIGNSPPLDPKIYLVRDDIQSWEHILHSKHKPLERKVWTATYSRATNDSTISLHLRKVFDDFALVKRFDPLQADNWYQVAKKDLPALLKTQRTLVQCLSTAYPEMSFNPEKFTVTYKNYWQDKENKRGFFDRFAREQGFDPLLPESWYNISSAAIMQHSKAGRAALKSYGKSLISALADVYNFVDFQVDKFVHLPQKHCHDEKNRLNSVLEVARLKGFDPLIADNWRNIKLEDFYAVKGGAGCLQWYGNSISKTLMSILPNIGLDYSYFRKPQSYWSSATNRKQFFDDFARSRNFDPLVPDNWYPFSYKDFLNFPGVDTVLMHYNRSVSGALMSLYPNVAFVVYKFHKVPANFWKEKENRRQVFEEVARVKGVQNLNDIYEWRAKVSPDDVNDLGSSLVKNYYSNSLTKALQDIFGIKFTTNS